MLRLDVRMEDLRAVVLQRAFGAVGVAASRRRDEAVDALELDAAREGEDRELGLARVPPPLGVIHELVADLRPVLRVEAGQAGCAARPGDAGAGVVAADVHRLAPGQRAGDLALLAVLQRLVDHGGASRREHAARTVAAAHPTVAHHAVKARDVENAGVRGVGALKLLALRVCHVAVGQRHPVGGDRGIHTEASACFALRLQKLVHVASRAVAVLVAVARENAHSAVEALHKQPAHEAFVASQVGRRAIGHPWVGDSLDAVEDRAGVALTVARRGPLRLVHGGFPVDAVHPDRAGKVLRGLAEGRRVGRVRNAPVQQGAVDRPDGDVHGARLAVGVAAAARDVDVPVVADHADGAVVAGGAHKGSRHQVVHRWVLHDAAAGPDTALLAREAAGAVHELDGAVVAGHRHRAQGARSRLGALGGLDCPVEHPRVRHVEAPYLRLAAGAVLGAAPVQDFDAAKSAPQGQRADKRCRARGLDVGGEPEVRIGHVGPVGDDPVLGTRVLAEEARRAAAARGRLDGAPTVQGAPALRPLVEDVGGVAVHRADALARRVGVAETCRVLALEAAHVVAQVSSRKAAHLSTRLCRAVAVAHAQEAREHGGGALCVRREDREP
mmetsp:Transcript_17429/g.52386  ORF Transcript_17429/g.52386 Transcript_17429/m.52386 type:complete len:613 (+) Transcript_17429:2391-4229(+)